MKFLTTFALIVWLATSMVAASGDWFMPETFRFNETQRFYWRITPGTNILSMLVRPESNPNNGTYLPLGGCQVQDPGAKCSQYTNNGTAEFGGYYAGGLTAGESYFISVNWITTDGSKTGTASSPSFVMEDPDHREDPKTTSIDKNTSSSIVDDSTKITSTATSTKTVHLSLITTLSTESTTPVLVVTPTLSVSSTLSPTAAASSQSLNGGQIAGISVASVGALASIIFLLFYLYKHRQKRKNAAKGAKETGLQDLPPPIVPQVFIEKQELDNAEKKTRGSELAVTEQEKRRMSYSSRSINRANSARIRAQFPPGTMEDYEQTAQERYKAGLPPTFELEGGILTPSKTYRPPPPGSISRSMFPPEVYTPVSSLQQEAPPYNVQSQDVVESKNHLGSE